jgi:peroxiredoxin
MSKTDAPPAVGSAAPAFTAPAVNDDGIDAEPLDQYLADGPVVLAFFPAAFSSTCTDELCTFRDRLGPLAEAGGTVLGISTDLPWALAEFRDQESLQFPLVADNDGSICDAYGVREDFDGLGIDGVARRAVFVVDGDGNITYRWLAENPGKEPDYEEVEAAVAHAAGD